MNPAVDCLLPPLPALRCLGDLSGVRPVLVVDTREQTPLPFARLRWERGTLQSGDYSFRGAEDLFAIERKTIPDLTTCCMGRTAPASFASYTASGDSDSNAY